MHICLNLDIAKEYYKIITPICIPISNTWELQFYNCQYLSVFGIVTYQ